MIINYLNTSCNYEPTPAPPKRGKAVCLNRSIPLLGGAGVGSYELKGIS